MGDLMFYGRKEELAILEEKYKSNKPEFVVIYGRRRVGKTELLNKFSEDKRRIFYTSKECTDIEQKDLFIKEISKSYTISKYLSKLNSWGEIFSEIGNIVSKEKILLIIDEFPYMAKASKSLMSFLQEEWDHNLSKKNIYLILCGSSMSFMEEQVLGAKNPLYGRATSIYKVEELNLYEVKKAFKKFSFIDIIKTYGVLGGVPYYINQIDENISFDENIVNNIINKNKILYNEVENLLRQEFREPAVYYSIIEAVAMGATKLNDIYNRTFIEKGKLSTYLIRLIELNIVKREYSIDTKTKSKSKKSRGLYKLDNNYFKFYFRYIYPYISEIEKGQHPEVFESIIKNSLNHYLGDVFEDVCIEYLISKNKRKELPVKFLKIGRWWAKNEEIDIVAFLNNNYIFAECKWKNEKVSIDVLSELIRKSSLVVNQDGINKYYYIFSKSGFKDNLIKEKNKRNDLVLVDIKELELTSP
jgi:uncharacterized protein